MKKIPNHRLTSLSRVSLSLIAGALILSPLTVVSAAGGGGGGGGAGGAVGGGSPSSSAPRYDAAAEYRSGIEQLNAGNFRQAARHFKRVTRVASRNAQAQYLLGVSYLESGEYKKARKPLERAVKYAPDMILAQRDLAITYIQIDRADSANEIMTQLAELAQACGETCADKAEIDQAIGAIERAMQGGAQAYLQQDFSRLADAGAADSIYYQAVGHINDGDFNAALDRLNDAALAFGPHPDILTYQGFANRKLARFGSAEVYYNAALSLAPDHLGALEYYGELKVERGDLEGARLHLAKLEKLCDFGCYEAEELRSWIDNAAP